MAITSVYSLPYQALTDPPHGPNLGQSLAQAVETELARIDAAVVAGDARLIGGKRYTAGGTSVSGVAATEMLVNMDTGPVTLQPGRQYRFPVRFAYIPSTGASSYWYLKLRKGGLAGAVWVTYVLETRTASFGMDAEFACVPPPVGVATTDTWVLTCQRLGGPDTLTINRGGTLDPTYVLVEDLGPASRVTAA